MPRSASPNASDRPTWGVRVVMLLGACVAAAALVRAFGMGLSQSLDFEIVFTSTLAWRLGLDAYDPDVFRSVWAAIPGAGDREFLDDEARSLYPPATYALLAPLTWLPLDVAKAVWALMNVAGLALGVAAMGRWFGTSRSPGDGKAPPQPGRLWCYFGLAVGVLLLWSVQTHFRFGQTAVLSVALVLAALSLWLDRRDARDPYSVVWAVTGMALAGAAVALKPQLALPLLGYAALRRRWIPVAGSLCVAGLWLGVGVGWMWGQGHDALAGLTRNVKQLADGGLMSAAFGAPAREHLLNFHLPLHAFTDNAAVVGWLVRIVVAALALPVAVAVWFRPQASDALAALAAIAAMSLMLTYHRGYDAVVLLPAVAWCVRAWLDADTPRRHAWTATLLLLPMATPGGTLLVVLDQRGWLSDAWTRGWWWQGVAIAFQAWAVASLAVWFAWRTWRSSRGRPESPPDR